MTDENDRTQLIEETLENGRNHHSEPETFDQAKCPRWKCVAAETFERICPSCELNGDVKCLHARYGDD